MKNDNRGRDIFMGLVAVATLIVAIIGATLAYFSITASSNEGVVNATAAVVSIEYNDGQQVTAQADELIPADFETVVKEAFKPIIGSAPVEDVSTVGNTCIDSNSRQVCSAYRFTVRSDIERTIKASLNNEENGFTYLSYAVYSHSANDGNGGWLTLDDDGNETLPLTQCSNKDDDETIPETLTNQCFTMQGTLKKYEESRAKNSIFGLTTENGLPAFKSEPVSGTTRVYDLVLFIREINDNQNIDQGKQYSGTIVIDVLEGAGNGNITGCIGDDCQ